MENYVYLFLTFVATFQLTSSFATIQNSNYIFKTFKVDGEGIVDCINMYKQPAFSHPLLANHTLQVKPSTHRKTLILKHRKSLFNQSWHKYGKCPVGYIPIKRSQTSNLPLKTRRVPKPLSPRRMSVPLPVQKIDYTGHKYAAIGSGPVAGGIHGAGASLNVWNPQVNGGFSLSQIWLAAGQGSQLNTMEVGWHVNPTRTGDDKTRLFIYWTSDAYVSTGCYDLSCPGFVQTNGNIIIGSSMNPSTYNGEQFELHVSIQKDGKSGNWWLYIHEHEIGYWPSSLFTSIATEAQSVEYGGEIYEPATSTTQNKNTIISTQMGSGKFSKEGFRHSCYVCDYTYTDSNGSKIHPHPRDLTFLLTSPLCYDSRMADRNHQPYFYFGGPGCASL